MGDINAKFRNNYSENGMCIVWDLGRDSSNPPIVFQDYLDSGSETPWITINDQGNVMYLRPQGAQTHPMTVNDGDTVNMSGLTWLFINARADNHLITRADS